MINAANLADNLQIAKLFCLQSTNKCKCRKNIFHPTQHTNQSSRANPYQWAPYESRVTI